MPYSFFRTILLACTFVWPGLLSRSQLALPEDTISIVAVGDIMLGTDYPSAGYLPPGGDCSPLMQDVLDYLNHGDITFGNLEGTFADTMGKAKICRDTLICYVFRMPVHFVQCLQKAGFDLLSLANNHSGDFGPGGSQNTMRVLDEAGIAYAGLLVYPSTVIVQDSVRYGFCAFAPNRGACNLKDTEAAVKTVKDLAGRSDVVIVSFHGGAEGKEHQHVTRQDETYLDYNRGNVYEFAHAVVDAGADLVFGHGPHVTRAVELYSNRLICYSLGNFCTYGRFNLMGPNGIAPIVQANIGLDGSFISGRIIPVYQAGRGITQFDPDGRVIRKMQELTIDDFPETPVVITDNGRILKK
jgi:hypothetical protein